MLTAKLNLSDLTLLLVQTLVEHLPDMNSPTWADQCEDDPHLLMIGDIDVTLDGEMIERPIALLVLATGRVIIRDASSAPGMTWRRLPGSVRLTSNGIEDIGE